MRITLRPLRIEGNVAFVPLTRGKEAIIDAEDAELVARWNWFAVSAPRTWYAARTERGAGFARTVYLRTLILPPKEGFVTIHLNGNGLDNRRVNLRHATLAQRRVVAPANVGNPTGLKGAYRTPGGRWQSWIRSGGRVRRLGVFDTAEEAHAAWRRAAEELYGSILSQTEIRV